MSNKMSKAKMTAIMSRGKHALELAEALKQALEYVPEDKQDAVPCICERKMHNVYPDTRITCQERGVVRTLRIIELEAAK